MKLIIRGRNVPISSALHEHCSVRLSRALQRFRTHVGSAELVLADVNGPRGGGHACRLCVLLGNGGQIVVHSLGDDFYLASSEVTSRVANLIGRELGRSRSRERRHSPSMEPLGAA